MNKKLPNRKLSKFVDLIENYVWKKWTKFMGLVLWEMKRDKMSGEMNKDLKLIGFVKEERIKFVGLWVKKNE